MRLPPLTRTDNHLKITVWGPHAGIMSSRSLWQIKRTHVVILEGNGTILDVAIFCRFNNRVDSDSVGLPLVALQRGQQIARHPAWCSPARGVYTSKLDPQTPLNV